MKKIIKKAQTGAKQKPVAKPKGPRKTTSGMWVDEDKFIPPFPVEYADEKPKRKMKAKPKAKNGKSFPDLNKDGKITKADILKGRGVIAKRGASIKKAQDGTVSPKVMNHPKVKKMRDTHQQNLSNFKAKAIKEREKTKETLRANLKKSQSLKK
jgi:hypothetical protein